MATITEDYVSFETAKLLKEKGFDVYGDGSLGSSTKVWMEYSPFGKIRDISTSTPSVKGFPAPTLQMAMKWLREVHNKNIILDMVHLDEDCYVLWTFNIYCNRNYKIMWGTKQPKYNTYEEACEAAIKYCLKNLI